jgi:crotonobetainyl-CoA:carnitine CoA-transferase CaiB-like acyl-CoA transferase
MVGNNELTPERPLAGVRVVDLSTSYAGPATTMYLADLGAEVIKVERPHTGDDTRHWGPPFVQGHSAWFASANRNKRSICINLRSAEGRLVLDRLISGANIVLESMNPSKLERLDLHPDQVCARHPHIIYGALSGFGLTGPDQELPGYDLIAQARSGLMMVTGESPESPQRVSTALSDIAAAMVASFALTAALRFQERTGKGTVIDVSLLDVDLALLAPRIASYLAGEPEPKPSGATDSVLAVYQTFVASDRQFVVAVGNDSIWRRLCGELDLTDLLDDEALRHNAGRRAHRPRIVDRLNAMFATAPAEVWVSRLRGVGVPCSLIHSFSEVIADKHVQARGGIVDLPLDGDTQMGVVGSPWRIGGAAKAVYTAPPALGADTEGVLAELGYSAAEVEELLQKEAVWRPTK